MFDLTDIAYVERIIVGSRSPEIIVPDSEVEDKVAQLNRCLTETPRGKIIGIEKTFSLLNIGEHQVVLQCIIYHVGFTRKPHWLISNSMASGVG